MGRVEQISQLNEAVDVKWLRLRSSSDTDSAAPEKPPEGCEMAGTVRDDEDKSSMKTRNKLSQLSPHSDWKEL